jgi:hypothetical protein
MAAESVEAANGAPPQVDDSLRDLLPDDDDLLYEEELLRNPYALRMWIRYIEARKSANPRKRYLLYERALNALPGSYKVRPAAAAGGCRCSGPRLVLPVGLMTQEGTLTAASCSVKKGRHCAGLSPPTTDETCLAAVLPRAASVAPCCAFARLLPLALPRRPPCCRAATTLPRPACSCGTPTCRSGCWRCGGWGPTTPRWSR